MTEMLLQAMKSDINFKGLLEIRCLVQQHILHCSKNCHFLSLFNFLCYQSLEYLHMAFFPLKCPVAAARLDVGRRCAL